MAADNTSVRVAIRIRPLVASEVSKGCQEIIEVIDENNQIIVKYIDKDIPYTFNYVMSKDINDEEIYNKSVKPLLGNIFKGYNVTVLAYGQTGSGKTHTMGTAYNGEGSMGIIPRAVMEIFSFIKDNFSYDFSITVSFIELYNEVLYDLLSDKPRENCVLDIREDSTKGIYIPSLTEIEVMNIKDVLDSLQKGTSRRATSATAMNAQSSRSHAVLTVSVTMNHKNNCHENKQAKLHLVDLAGSERSKKTLATGSTFKEGININKGLLALGNVISSLGDEKAQHGFIPYRDSNLTRLLKDSLGGNSITLMIACVSPADYNMEETVSTLRYADRARKIKNKPIINQDPKAAEINALKKTIQQLRLQILGQGGATVAPEELESLKKEVAKKRDLSIQLSATLTSNTCLHEKIIILQNASDLLGNKLKNLQEKCNTTLNNITLGMETNNMELLKENLNNLQEINNQIIEINLEQKRTDEEINDHDAKKHTSRDSEDGSKGVSTPDLEEEQECHANRQFKLNIQLTKIEQELNLKENLAKQLINNNHNLVDQQALVENEVKISQLEQEKEELLQMLKNVGGISGKIAEQRRKRVIELEQQLMELKKKVQQQNNLLKVKAKAEERIKVLNQEIVQIKQAKVKLVKSMREESDKFRQWKLEKERECIRLKKEDKKKEYEISKMKIMHNKQQNVFKRRVEEAESINKRLKQALALKKQTQDTKNIGKAEKLEPWLKQEFNLYVNIVEAEATLKVLLEDRATLHVQLDELKNDSADDNEAECLSIKEDLELRSAQIQDLQQKLLESDEETRSKNRLEKFQTMGEAKYGLKFLFAKVGEVVKEKVNIQMKLSEVNEINKEHAEKLNEAKKIHSADTRNLHEEYEEKVALLLKMKEDELLEKLASLNVENESLKKQLENIMAESAKVPKTPIIIKEQVTFQQKNKQKTSEILTPININQNIENMDDTVVEEDDTVNDPDWRKTPLGKRIIEEKRKLSRSVLNFGNEKPVKRSSDGGCTCKTNCELRCGCRRMGRSCGTSCKCKENTCENREKLPTELNADFKKPSAPEEDEAPTKKNRKTRYLFKLE